MATLQHWEGMDISGQINEELLICKICYGRFTSSDRLPKLLVCSHTFCAECIVQYLRKRKKSKRQFPCPLCRKETALGKDGVAGLGNNFTVMGLIDILDRQAINDSNTWHGQQQSTLPSHSPPPGDSPHVYKHRPALQTLAWSTPGGSSAIHCDNCDNAARKTLICGHMFCDHCANKCDDGECIQCGGGLPVGEGARQRTKSPTEAGRPPAFNPTYPTSSMSSPPPSSAGTARSSTLAKSGPPRPSKPPVPQRTSPVKPIHTITAGSRSASSLQYGISPPPPSHMPPRHTSQPALHQRGLSPPPSCPPPEHRPHSVHISSTLPSMRSAFGGSPMPGQVMLPMDTTPAEASMPRSLTSPNLPGMGTLPRRRRGPSPRMPGDATLPRRIGSPVSPPMSGNGTLSRRMMSPPQPPARRICEDTTAMASPLRCMNKFGHYSAVRLQTNAFNQPTHIAASEFTQDWAVVDSINMTIQLFDSQGSYISMFKVMGIKSACFISTDKLAISTHRGIEIYRPDGVRLKELLIGSTNCVFPFKHGFLACQQKSILTFSNSFTRHPSCDITKRRTGKLRRATSFKNIVSIAVNYQRELIVLDSTLGDITVLDTEDKRAVAKLVINPSKEACGKLRAPESVAVDRMGNVIVSDTGNQRLLRFTANGIFSRPLLSFGLSPQPTDLTVHGVAVGPTGCMGVVIAGRERAEVRVYQLV